MLKNFYSSAKQSYHDYRFRLDLRRQLRQPEAILVHQMGKVGSSSVYHSLNRLNLGIAVCHSHFLNSQRLTSYVQSLKLKKVNLWLHVITSQELRSVLDRGLENKKWKVITLVREPIARNISAFFENIDTGKHSDLYIDNFEKKYSSGVIILEDLMQKFINQYAHTIPLEWLDWEIKDVFNIDIYSQEFPKARGYQIIKTSNVELLVLKLETLNECIQPAISEFLGIENFKFKIRNQAEKRVYKEVYGTLRKSIKFPETFLCNLYDSKYTKHFYSQEEIEKLKERWRDKKTQITFSLN